MPRPRFPFHVVLTPTVPDAITHDLTIVARDFNEAVNYAYALVGETRETHTVFDKYGVPYDE